MKVIVFLADGFEEVEALTVVDYLRRVNIEIDMVSITDDKQVKGAHEIKVLADKVIKDIDASIYDGVVIPGGMPGASNLRDDDRVIDIVKSMNKEEKMIAAICAGPIVLDRAGIIKGKGVTSYPGFEDQLNDVLYKEVAVVRDRNIITSRGPAFAVDFALEIVKYLLCEKRVEALKKDILYN